MNRIDIRQFGIRHLLVILAVIGFCLWLGSLDETLFYMFAILGVAGSVGATAVVVLFFISDWVDGRGINERGWYSRFFNFLGLLSFVGTSVLVALMVMAILFYGGLRFLDAVAPQLTQLFF